MFKSDVIIVFDLGPGDGGKGGVVHKLSCDHQAHTIIKVGGAQGNHGVKTEHESFGFSQWGCGTFEGVKTHITPLMVVSPTALLNEAEALSYNGIDNAFDLLTIDENALCATPYHGIVSRLNEISRGEFPRGTIGSGVGEAYRDNVRFAEQAIKVKDLKDGSFKRKLIFTRKRIKNLVHRYKDCAITDQDDTLVHEEIALAEDDHFLDHCISKFEKVAELANIVDGNCLAEILKQDGTAVVESSHGILTDRLFGFYPHVSAIRTLPLFTHHMLKKTGFDGNVKKLGVHRAYTIRHGAGPMPTCDPSMNEDLLPGSHKEENRYQGKVRVGPLDFVLLRYASEVCGGPEEIDGLAITWFDQISKNNVWKVCSRYNNPSRWNNLVHDSTRLKVNDSTSSNAGVGHYTSLLNGCKPIIESLDVPESKEEQFNLCYDRFYQELGIPVEMVSFGAYQHDKLYKGLQANV